MPGVHPRPLGVAELAGQMPQAPALQLAQPFDVGGAGDVVAFQLVVEHRGDHLGRLAAGQGVRELLRPAQRLLNRAQAHVQAACNRAERHAGPAHPGDFGVPRPLGLGLHPTAVVGVVRGIHCATITFVRSKRRNRRVFGCILPAYSPWHPRVTCGFCWRGARIGAFVSRGRNRALRKCGGGRTTDFATFGFLLDSDFGRFSGAVTCCYRWSCRESNPLHKSF